MLVLRLKNKKCGQSRTSLNNSTRSISVYFFVMFRIAQKSLRAAASSCKKSSSFHGSAPAVAQFQQQRTFFSSGEDKSKDSEAAAAATAAATEAGADSAATATPQTPGPKAAASASDERIAALEKEVKELKDKVLRAYAEEENVRRIAKRDVNNAKDYATSSFAKGMLDVADDIERALKSVSHETTDNKDLNLLVEGLQMTEKNVQKVFGRFGLVKFGAVDDVFDPELHDALFKMPTTETQKEGTVGLVLKSGYRLKDRVIRAAEVGTRA